MEQNLDSLKKIKSVDAPPFLFTRIQAKIDLLSEAPIQWKWGFAVTAFVLVAVNLGVAFSSSGSDQKAGVEVLASAMHLSTANSLYNE